MNTYVVYTGNNTRLRLTLDRYHGELLALMLGFEPYTGDGYVAVYTWLQEALKVSGEHSLERIREHLHARVLAAIVAPRLQRAFTAWTETMAPADWPRPSAFRTLRTDDIGIVGR